MLFKGLKKIIMKIRWLIANGVSLTLDLVDTHLNRYSIAGAEALV